MENVWNNRPELAELQNQVMTNNWQTLGLQLGLNNDRLEGFRKEHPGDIADCRQRMFALWLQTKPNASRQQVLDALRTKAVSEIYMAETYEKYISQQLSQRTTHSDDTVAVDAQQHSEEVNQEDKCDPTYKVLKDFDKKVVEIPKLALKAKELQKRFRILISSVRESLKKQRKFTYLKHTVRSLLTDALNITIPSLQPVIDELHQISSIDELFEWLIDRRYMSYFNYDLLAEFADAANDRAVKPLLQEYAKKYYEFLEECTFEDLIVVFKQYPDLSPHAVNSLPSIIVKIVRDPQDLELQVRSWRNRGWKPSRAIMQMFEKNSTSYAIFPADVRAVIADIQRPETQNVLQGMGATIEIPQDTQKLLHLSQIPYPSSLSPYAYNSPLRTHQEDCSSQSVIAISTSSLVCHTKESVIASRATLNEILKKAENLDEQMKKELCKLNDNLAAVEKNVEQLHGICENNKEGVNELKVEKAKTEDKITSLDDSMEAVKEKVNEMDRKHSDHEIRLKVENYIDGKKSQEQMQERKIQLYGICDLSPDLIPSKSEQLSTSLHNMELIAEYHTKFSSDKPLSVDWDKYGCRLQIPESSIPQGEVGTLDLYAIYSGPFQFPEDSSPVSAYYFITLSHDLQKPATLELQHCYIINNDDDSAQLTFASATTSTGPPYCFRPVIGGSFLPGKYAVIHQTKFSIFGILVAHVRAIGQSISRWFNSVQYALSYFLIRVQYPKMWIVKLFITQYTNAHIEHLKQQERSEKPVYYEYFLFVLEDGVDTVSTLVVPEEDSITDLKARQKKWKTDKTVVMKKWEVLTAVTEVPVVSEPPPCIQFRIEWIDELPAERCVFHIHIFGIIQDIRIPVSVPFPIGESGSMSYPTEKQLKSTDLPDILRATNEISDWFTLGIFLKVDYSKLKTLQKDYPSDHNHCRQEMLMFWISSGNATWSILVKTLRDDMNEPGLAERIEEGHLR